MPYPSLQRTTTDLPIERAASAISDAVASGGLVLTAEPGAGKSSVVPLLAAERFDGRVIVLEPRRLAARATATRLSSLLPDCTGVGDLVGLSIRGEHRLSGRTRIEVVTEAILTQRLQRDPELPGVSALVFDEFHERNLHSDLSLGMALESRATIRPDLVIVIMSATLDPGPVAGLLGTSNVVEVPGRTFDVETMHLPRPSRRDWVSSVASTSARAAAETDGDVLVFVPGRREINDVVRGLASTGRPTIGLHGGSGADIQREVMTVAASPRIIVATAVAETSLTIPGVRTVVDGGLLRRARFDPLTGLGRLETVNVTRFAADQRRGRAGRVSEGRCYRLWSVEDHRHLDDAVPPEIVDGDPLPVSFELARWGDPRALDLPLLDHPGAERLEAGRSMLEQLGLVDDAGALTDEGKRASELGLHPRLARLLLVAQRRELTELGLTVAALLDGDSWPTQPDLMAESERRARELSSAASRLRQRLSRNTHNQEQADMQREPDKQWELDKQRELDTQGTGPRSAAASLDELPVLLAAAWPDRVAQARRGTTDKGDRRWHLATGREVLSGADDPLSRHDFIVVAEADGNVQAGRVRRAVGLDRATLLEALSDQIEWLDEIAWDDRDDRLRAERQQRLGALVLHSQPLPSPDPTQVSEALAVGLARRGLDLLRWSEKAISLRARLAWLHLQDPDLWPSMTDEALLERRDEWLDLASCRSPEDVRRLDAGRNLLNLLAWPQRNNLDGEAPSELATPAGRPRRLDYSSGRPVWAVRIQDLFGLDRHPMIGPRQVPVTIELLSPANRPAQVTTDLPGFWRGSYAAVRADLRGRYPKHRWPEEPWRDETS